MEKTTNWEILLTEADKYYKMVAAAMTNEVKKFNNEFYLNIMTVAIEKYFASLLNFKEKMPAGHDFETLFMECSEYFDCKLSLINDIKFIDSFQNLCSLEPNQVNTPDNNDLKKAFMTFSEIRLLVYEAMSLASIGKAI